MQIKLLQSSAFVFGLIILLANDFILKYHFPGWLTGKLSDFAGLFIFPLFWIAFFPKYRRSIFVATVLGFLWWNTPFADPFIDCWNEWMFYPIRRVLDYTDYIALLSVLLAWEYSKSEIKTFKISAGFVGVVAFFSFCATQAIEPVPYDYCNPPVVLFYYKTDSLRTNELELSTHNFVLDSTGVFKLDKEQERTREYYPEAERRVEVDDSLLLIKTFQHYYFEEYAHTGTCSGKVRFMERLKSTRKNLSANYFRTLSTQKLAEDPQFTIEHGERRPRTIPVKHHPVDARILDTFDILTNAFGALEKFHFKEGNLHGPYLRYYDSTTVSVKGFFQDGLEVGIWAFYDSTGVQIKEEIYHKGELRKVNIIENGKRRKGEGAITKTKVIASQIGMLLFCLFGFFTSYRWYGRIAPEILDEEESRPSGILNVLFRLIASIGFAITITLGTICTFSVLSQLHLFGWDLPIGLDHFFYFILLGPIIPFVYFLSTGRYGDFLWVMLWMNLTLMFFGSLAYLWSLF